MLYKIKKYFNGLRKIFYRKEVTRKAMSVGAGLKINFPTKVTSKTKLGNNFNSNGLKVLGSGMVTVGDNFHCGFGCVIITENHNHMGERIPYDSSYIVKDVFIDANVWLGINVILLPGVTIGEGAIIQAGSVVVNDIPALAIAGGHPAKVFSWRNKEHYYNLKQKKLFH